MTDEARVLDALGDPTRRVVLELLRGGERSVRQLTDAAAVSQPAVSQHLRVLRDAGLVTVRPEGTRRFYRIDLAGLAGLRAWVDGFWDDALAAFVTHADGEAGR
jgi:DNA-binding transcriptional ArsR family regulator